MTAMPCSAKRNAALAAIVANYREQRKRQSRDEAIAEQDAARHERGQRHCRKIGPRQTCEDLPRLNERAGAS